MTEPPDAKKQRVRLSRDAKLNLIIDVENGASQVDIAKKWGINPSTVSKFMAEKEIIRAEQKPHSSKYNNLDEALLLWFIGKRDKGIPFSGPLLHSKAIDLANMVGLPPPTMGFIDKFKQRHEIVFKKLHGEAANADCVGKEEWLAANLHKISSFNPRDVYNMDETGLFYLALPSGTLCFKEDIVKGSKTMKNRITVAVTVNMDGSYKNLLVIGQSKKPRCFRVNPPCLPYVATKKAWMTVKTFKNWLTTFDRNMVSIGRHALLLIDNAPVHITGLHKSKLGDVTNAVLLKNTEVMFFPPNVTSILQP